MERCRVWIRIDTLPSLWIEELQRNIVGAEFWQGNDGEADTNWISKAKVVFTDSTLPDRLIQRLYNLKWVQFTRGTAYELIEPSLRDSDVAVSVIPAIDGLQFSEFAMGSILLWALREGWIAGVTLDALPRQPLPPDSALWELPNVFITPRVAGYTPNRWKRLIPVFEENLRKFLSGQEFPVINKALGM